MTQSYKSSSELEIPEIEEIEEPKAQESKESEADELLGDLNPRFFEEAYS